MVVAVVKDIIDGKLQGKHYQFASCQDWGPVMTKTDLLPPQIKEVTAGLQSKIVSGEIKPKNVVETAQNNRAGRTQEGPDVLASAEVCRMRRMVNC